MRRMLRLYWKCPNLKSNTTYSLLRKSLWQTLGNPWLISRLKITFPKVAIYYCNTTIERTNNHLMALKQRLSLKSPCNLSNTVKIAALISRIRKNSPEFRTCSECRLANSEHLSIIMKMGLILTVGPFLAPKDGEKIKILLILLSEGGQNTAQSRSIRIKTWEMARVENLRFHINPRLIEVRSAQAIMMKMISWRKDMTAQITKFCHNNKFNSKWIRIDK